MLHSLQFTNLFPPNIVDLFFHGIFQLDWGFSIFSSTGCPTFLRNNIHIKRFRDREIYQSRQYHNNLHHCPHFWHHSAHWSLEDHPHPALDWPEKDHDDENNPIFILVHLHRKESDKLCKEPLVHVFIHLVEDEPVSDTIITSPSLKYTKILW